MLSSLHHNPKHQPSGMHDAKAYKGNHLHPCAREVQMSAAWAERGTQLALDCAGRVMSGLKSSVEQQPRTCLPALDNLRAYTLALHHFSNFVALLHI